MTETALERLDLKFQVLRRHMAERPEISMTYFVPDSSTPGGTYATVNGIVERFDDLAGEAIMEDGVRILLERVTDMRGEIFVYI